MPPRVTVGTGITQILGNHRAKFEHPPADCLITDNEATLRQKIFEIPVASPWPCSIGSKWQLTQLRGELETAVRYIDEGAAILAEFAFMKLLSINP
jgi:hypothetical protein